MDGSLIKAAIKKAGKTQEEVANLLNMTRENLNKILNGKITSTHVAMIESVGIDLSFVKKSEESEKRVPLYDIDSTAGNVTIFAEDGPEYVKQYLTVPAFSDCQMYIAVSGNSMYPKYCSGELIALKKIEDLDVVALGEAYVIVTKEQRLLKYIRKGRDKDHWTLASENSEYEPFEIPKKKVLHLYIVKGKITKNII